jgi:hypothetical protein
MAYLQSITNAFMPARRFPPPWTAEVTPNCFIVRDANGQTLSYTAASIREGAKT